MPSYESPRKAQGIGLHTFKNYYNDFEKELKS